MREKDRFYSVVRVNGVFELRANAPGSRANKKATVPLKSRI